MFLILEIQRYMDFFVYVNFIVYYFEESVLFYRNAVYTNVLYNFNHFSQERLIKNDPEIRGQQ